MKLKLLILSVALSFSAWSQITHTVILSGYVIDSASGAGIPNYPVIVNDSTNTATGGTTVTLLTDANGNYNDTLILYGSSGVLLIQTLDSCTGNWQSSSAAYSMNTPQYFSVNTGFVVCGSSGSGGGGTGGGSNTTGCVAQYGIDTTLTGMGQIVLYNTSYVDSSMQNATVSYVWYFGDGTSAVGGYPSHMYTTAGSYEVCVTLSAVDSTAFGTMTCTSTYCDTINIDSTGNVSYKNVNVALNIYNPAQMSLQEKESAPVKMYPNPSTGITWVELPLASDVQIFSMTGHCLFSAKAMHGKVQLPLLSSGSYILEVLNSDGEKHQLLLVH